MLGLMAIDVDGTLVGTANVVREDVWAALAQARAQGMRLAICSGRPAVGNALEYARKLDADGWHVFQNGASVVKVDTGESLSEPFPAQKLQALIEHARHTDRLLEIYTDTEYAITKPGELAERHAALLGLPYRPIRPEDLSGTVVRVQWVAPIEDSAQITGEPHEGLELHPAGSPVMRDTIFVSVTKAGVDKGSAIRRVAEKYGLGMNRVMAVGDGSNDLHLLRAVGHPVAMGNAEDVLKAVAETVVGHVDEGGLVEAVQLAQTL
ncbi:Cof-type HAD-IIB family hydrolase [Deinococcus fonticola]|uniref:Cof-type HAD-IIB family hydrolase n=1 Tax=Deinococcus fonticola TaxID=2528713 RepID=UPI001074EAE0|nr:Cof-type HAD-IIB family hydrolase [Deinococcus fonticola]